MKFDIRFDVQADGKEVLNVRRKDTQEIVAQLTSLDQLEKLEIDLVKLDFEIEEVSRLSENISRYFHYEQILTPVGWGKDGISHFLDLTQKNSRRVFHEHRAFYQVASQVDNLFHVLNDGWINPDPHEPMLFLMRAHSFYKSAAGLILSGQLPEAHMVMRSCLECALYGFTISKDTGKMFIWLHRNDDAAAQRACRSMFGSPKKIVDEVKATDSALGSIFEQLYETCIDRGGHPNQRSIVPYAKYPTQDDMRMSLGFVMYDPLYIQGALKTLAQVGVAALKLFSHIYPDRYSQIKLKGRIHEVTRGTKDVPAL